jgi:hypothetical protein
MIKFQFTRWRINEWSGLVLGRHIELLARTHWVDLVINLLFWGVQIYVPRRMEKDKHYFTDPLR